MVDFITSRGTIFYILIWVVLSFTIKFGHRWFFKHYDADNDKDKFVTFLIIFLALISFTFIIPIEDGGKRSVPIVLQ